MLFLRIKVFVLRRKLNEYVKEYIRIPYRDAASPALPAIFPCIAFTLIFIAYLCSEKNKSKIGSARHNRSKLCAMMLPARTIRIRTNK